ncbi:MAG: Rrf2 family transcriptional regulator [Candidatus Saccharicenans sp.]|nr:Rrf2 family transcriptional regulator [Candidatus Saccharicenans sp.]
MFRISTKGRYGTRLMLNLAMHFSEKSPARSLKEIAEEEDISLRYLEQIIIPLRDHRLVISQRGAGGGYTLTRPPAAIKLSEVLQAVEGNCCLVECVEDERLCKRASYCAAHEIWKEGTRVMKNYFDSISLQDMVKIAEKKSRRKSKSLKS